MFEGKIATRACKAKVKRMARATDIGDMRAVAFGELGSLLGYIRGPDVQIHWSVSDLARLMYEGQDASTEIGMERLLASTEDILSVHKLIWPAENANELVEATTVRDMRVKLWPTSVMLSALVWGFRASKRPMKLRLRAAALLKHFLSQLCKGQATLPLLLFRPGASMAKVFDLELRSVDQVIPAWSDNYRDFLTELWELDLQDAQKTWISGPISSVTLIQYTLFSLDPLPWRLPALRNMTFAEAKFTKQQLLSSVLGLLSAAALAFEHLWGDLDYDDGRALKSRKIGRANINMLIADIAERLFSGKDPRFQSVQFAVVPARTDGSRRPEPQFWEQRWPIKTRL